MSAKRPGLGDLIQAERDVRRWSDRRRALPAGSSRARVTTLNAKWSSACEKRDRILRQCEERGLIEGGKWCPGPEELAL